MTDTMKKSVNFEKVYKWIFVLMCAFSVMPWFSFSSESGAYCGSGMLGYFWLPFTYIFFKMWVQEGRLGWRQLLLGEMAYICILGVLVYAFFNCQDLMWVSDQVDWRVSMDISLLPFWICCFFSICGAVLFPVYVRKRNIAQGVRI